MPTLVIDPDLSAQLIEQRRAWGADHHDEVWEGVYIMSPLPNNEHQRLVAQLTAVLIEVVDQKRLGKTYPGVNLADREKNWQQNYRCPDVVVFLRGNSAKDCGTHWNGGPDLAIEVVSAYDRTRDKIDFYETIRTRELLIIERDPWQLELLKLTGSKLTTAGIAMHDNAMPVVSESTGLEFRMVQGADRPEIVVSHADHGSQWTL